MTTADKIALFSAVGGWVSGLGALLAVIVSLYLANRKTKVQIKCDVGERLIISKGSFGDSSKQSGIAIVVTNLTSLPVKITGIGWSCGKGHYWHQILGDKDSDVLPKKIEYGDQGFFWVSLEGKEESWFQGIAKQMKDKKANISKLKVSISTASGGLFYFSPEKELKAKFSEYYKKA
ncbi:hypothetical protein [Dryocola clanedunensis]